MKKINQKSSYKNSHLVNSEPELIRVQINPCEDFDDANSEEILINDLDCHWVKNNETKDLPSNNFLNDNDFKIDELNSQSNDFFNKKNSDNQVQKNESELQEIVKKTFEQNWPEALLEKNDNSQKSKNIQISEFVLPEIQTIENENLDLQNLKTEIVIPKYEIIDNENLNLSNLNQDNYQTHLLTQDNVEPAADFKNHKKELEIDDNQWTVVPNFDGGLFNTNNVHEVIENSEYVVQEEIVENSSVNLSNSTNAKNLNQKKILNKKIKTNNKKAKKTVSKKIDTSSLKKKASANTIKKKFKNEVVAPDVISVVTTSNKKKIIKTKIKKITKKKIINNKTDLDLVKTADLIISNKNLKNPSSATKQKIELNNLVNTNNYIKPNNEIISTNIELNSESKFENNLIVSPLPVNAETFQNYYENNLFLNNKNNFESNNPISKEISSITSLANSKRKFKGPEIVLSPPFANKHLKNKKQSKNNK